MKQVNLTTAKAQEGQQFLGKSSEKAINPGKVHALGSCRLNPDAPLVGLVRRRLDVELVHQLNHCRLNFSHTVDGVIPPTDYNNQVRVLVLDKLGQSLSSDI